MNEMLSTEAQSLARSHDPSGDQRHFPHSILIQQEQMNAPPAARIALHTVKETSMTGIDQPAPQDKPITSDAQFFASSGCLQASEANIRVKVLFKEARHRLGAWEFHGDEVGQKGGDEGGEIVCHAGIYPAPPKTLFQKYLSNDSGLDEATFAEQRRPSRC